MKRNLEAFRNIASGSAQEIMMNCWLAVLLLCAASSQKVNAQTALPKSVNDSLQRIWRNPSLSDTTRLNAAYVIASEGFLRTNPDSSMHYAKMCYELARKGGNKHHMSNALSVMGINSKNLGRPDEAMVYYEECFGLAKEIGDSLRLARTLLNMGIVHDARGDLRKALDCFQQGREVAIRIKDPASVAAALNAIGLTKWKFGDLHGAIQAFYDSVREKKKIGEKRALASTYSNIGLVQMDQKDFKAAIGNFRTALVIQKESNDRVGLAKTQVNIGRVLGELGEVETAIVHFQESLRLCEELGAKAAAAETLINFGVLLKRQGKLSDSEAAFNRALTYADDIQDKAAEASALANLSDVLVRQGDNKRAIQAGEKALALANDIGYVTVVRDAATSLYKGLKANGQMDKALSMYELAIVMKDSIQNEENRKGVMRQQFQYDYEKRELLILAEQEKKDVIAAEEIKRKNQQRNAFIGGFALMLGLAGVSYRSYRQKKHDNIIISKEKERSEELLLNILPHEVAEELKEKGHADARLIDHATVLFTDFKGFTAMSEQMSPQELVYDLNVCFSEFDRICGRYGIEKIKTIGDAYMAAGGLPTANHTHATDVVRAALEMREFVAAGKVRKMETGQPYFEIRIGIHTGPVVAGIVGIKKFQYDIWGDTVNTASRMESSGEVGRINVSESTYELVKDHFSCIYRGEVEAKGKGKMGMYFVEYIGSSIQ